MSDSDPASQLPKEHEEDFRRLVDQLKAEEVSASDARLSSLESLELWIQSNPLLRQSQTLTEIISAYGPAILEIIKRFV